MHGIVSLASTFDGAPDLDLAKLAMLLPRFEKLLKRNGFKVKMVQDTLNQMLELWKQVPDVSDEVMPPPKS
ncbi:hypothetical protein E2542_SST20413 [Spatholobus suberectus]|nr:hypothetical protein E2542_SST20413 [Spatholobus suberectus]